MISIDDILNAMSGQQPFATILLLDSCRDYRSHNNNSKKDINRVSDWETVSLGLCPVNPTDGQLIVFASLPGNVTTEPKEERNSVFTKHLLKHLKTPNKSIETILCDIEEAMKQESDIKQAPYINSSELSKEIYLYTIHSGKKQPIRFSVFRVLFYP